MSQNIVLLSHIWLKWPLKLMVVVLPLSSSQKVMVHVMICCCFGWPAIPMPEWWILYMSDYLQAGGGGRGADYFPRCGILQGQHPAIHPWQMGPHKLEPKKYPRQRLKAVLFATNHPVDAPHEPNNNTAASAEVGLTQHLEKTEKSWQQSETQRLGYRWRVYKL